MRIVLWLFICAWLYPLHIFSQQTYNVSGQVKDERNQPLPGATVLMPRVQKGTVSDVNGYFYLNGFNSGNYIVEISFLGYETFKDTLNLQKDIALAIRLKPSLKSLQEVVITDNYAEQRKKEEPLNIEIVNDNYLRQNLGGSLMKSLERLPGVSTIDIGSGQSKPVIRGLGFNRVVVLENGVKHEGQQWGADHGLEIDQFAVDRIEVIKGPASLVYGSDAIGGIIDLKQTETPAVGHIGGSIDLIGKSNNNLVGSSAYFYARKNNLFITFRGTLINYADYRVPTDSVDIYSYKAALCKNRLRNTAGNEQNFHISFGLLEKHFSSRFYISSIFNKGGFFANAHGLEPRDVDTVLHDKNNRDIHYPFQQVNHIKVINKSEFRKENLRIETELGFQRNYRQEWSQYTQHGYMPPSFPDTLTFPADLERQFDKYIYSGNVQAVYPVNGKSTVKAGVNVEYQDNNIDGRGFIIPAFRQTTAGSFLYLKHSFSSQSMLHAGIRYDYGTMGTSKYSDWFPSPVETEPDTVWTYLQRAPDLKLYFSNVSWSVGYNYAVKNIALKFNVGKSFRMPIAKELAANGVNYHHFSYEIGNPDLSPEISYQFDMGAEWNTKRFAVGLTPYINYFSNYIYLNPSYEHDRLYGNGNQVFYYTQSKVIRYGGELHTHYEIWGFINIGGIAEYVYSEQLSGEKKGFTLPFSPPPSALFNLKFTKEKLWALRNLYLTFDYKLVAAQNNVVPPEDKTPGYQVINVGFGGVAGVKNQNLNFSVQVQNLLNNKYFNHTSYYRLINVPEPGRNFVLNISIPFSGKMKQNTNR